MLRMGFETSFRVLGTLTWKRGVPAALRCLLDSGEVVNHHFGPRVVPSSEVESEHLCCDLRQGSHTSALTAPSPLENEHKQDARMKVVAAYLLLALGGNSTPSAEDIKSLLETVGAEAEDSSIETFLKELKGKDLNEVIAAGREKFAAVPGGGGGGGGVVVAAAGGGGGGAAPAAAEEKKEEKKEEEKEESDDDMGFSLFD